MGSTKNHIFMLDLTICGSNQSIAVQIAVQLIAVQISQTSSEQIFWKIKNKDRQNVTQFIRIIQTKMFVSAMLYEVCAFKGGLVLWPHKIALGYN